MRNEQRRGEESTFFVINWIRETLPADGAHSSQPLQRRLAKFLVAAYHASLSYLEMDEAEENEKKK